MRQLQAIDNDISEIGMTHDDAIMGANSGGSGGGGGMSIGSGTAVQNLNKEEQQPPEDYTPYIPEQPIFPEPEPTTPEETKATQGEQSQEISKANKEIEKWNDFLENKKRDLHTLVNSLSEAEIPEFEKYMQAFFKKHNLGNNYNFSKDPMLQKAFLDGWANQIMGKYRDAIYDIQTSKDYDPRTVEEQRQDTATQRAAKDYIAAGLNPKALSGFTGGGGGGGGGNSKDDEEEKKRKRRRQELEEIRRARKAEKMREIELVTGIVQSLTNTATKAVGGAAFMGHQKDMQKKQHSHDMNIEGIRNIYR